jgi:hypothetical protein
MKIPVITGMIDRRILVNYRVNPDVVARILPKPFRPKLIKGMGMAGICLIRLQNIRPRFLPSFFGMSSENAAHRIAVEWDQDGETKEGVFVPRRDTSNRINTLLGGRIFPGRCRHATFTIQEDDNHFRVALDSDDGNTHMLVDGNVAEEVPSTSVFSSVKEASSFFEKGSLGYSVTPKRGQFEGLQLHSFDWHVQPMAIEKVESSYFEDEARFPRGSIELDCALLMRGIRHEWYAKGILCDGLDC